MNLNWAHDFMIRSFFSGESIAVLLRREEERQVAQRVVTLAAAVKPRYLAWLAHENRTGANIYIGANPLHPGSLRRTKESVACVRHLYLDIDTDGENRLAALLANEQMPKPNVTLSTSPGKYQALWKVEGFDFDAQELTLKLLASAFGGDPACTDRNRVLRLPGFSNRKYEPTHVVTAEYLSDQTYAPSQFAFLHSSSNVSLFPTQSRPRNDVAKQSNSENDWAWVSRELKRGADPRSLTSHLAALRADKPNPSYYAQRTVDIASACLLLRQAMKDVIETLEERRRSEMPEMICSARAREIVATAKRMIDRKQIA